MYFTVLPGSSFFGNRFANILISRVRCSERIGWTFCEKWKNSGMGNKYVIVLTACINPGKMIHTSLTDVDIRRRQYEDALEFYLLQTDYPIVLLRIRGLISVGIFGSL